MLLDWIKRAPARFAGFALSGVELVMLVAEQYGLPDGISAAFKITCAMGLAWFVEAISVPTVKLSEPAIARAAAMTTADIAVVAATKAEGAKP